MVASECKPEAEEKYNKWYDEVHIPMLLKFKGLKEVIRYRLVGETGAFPKYLTVYKFESPEAYEAYGTSPERSAAMDELATTWKQGGFEVKWRVVYEPLKTWKKR